MAIEIIRDKAGIVDTQLAIDYQNTLLKHAGKIAVWSTFYAHRDIQDLKHELNAGSVDPKIQELIEGKITFIRTELAEIFDAKEGLTLENVSKSIDIDH